MLRVRDPGDDELRGHAPSALDEMLQGLMADGVVQSKGSFTLNPWSDCIV